MRTHPNLTQAQWSRALRLSHALDAHPAATAEDREEAIWLRARNGGFADACAAGGGIYNGHADTPDRYLDCVVVRIRAADRRAFGLA